MSKQHEQYLIELSRQCYSLMQDQINKRNTVIGFWTTVTALVYSAVFVAQPSPVLTNFLLLSFFVVGFLYCNVILGLISWQNSYKKSCDIIGKVLMNSDRINNLAELEEIIAIHFESAKVNSKKGKSIGSLSNRVIICCFIVSILPYMLFVVVNEYHNDILHLLISTLLFALYSVFYFTFSYAILKKHKNSIPWLLKFELQTTK